MYFGGTRYFSPSGLVHGSPPCYPARVNTIERLLPLGETLTRDGYAFVPAEPMRQALRATGPLDDWSVFTASWDDLAPDTYLTNYGRYRRRRHAVFAATALELVRCAHEPHYQSREYNVLQGGIARWFEPIHAIADGASLRTILHFCHALFAGLVPTVRKWRIEVHQFRIEARDGVPGQPTPEGVHRDGVDYVAVLLVRRTNIAQGTTSIHAPDGRVLGSFTLIEPFDAALVEDARVTHGVTPVEPVDTAEPAFRDVLVVTFKRDDH